MTDNTDISTGDIFAMLKGQTNPTELRVRRLIDGIMRKLNGNVSRIEVQMLTHEDPTRQELLALGVKGFTRLVGENVTEFEKRHTRVLKQDLHGGHNSHSDTIDALTQRIALRMVLATREHIPNKIEAKEARRAAASVHHGPKKKGGSRMAKKAEERKREQNPWAFMKKESKQARARRQARGLW